MLEIDHETLLAITQGATPTQKVVIYWNFGTEEYTSDNYLKTDGIFSLVTNVSQNSRYELGNVPIILLNIDYYFSRLFTYEVPTSQLVVIFDVINDVEIEIFRGKVYNWYLTEQEVYLTIAT